MSSTTTNRGSVERPRRLVDAVYEALLDRLMSLEIAPGERLSIDGLARELDVSQTPIREALSRLEQEGIVTSTHLVGYRAAPQLDARKFEELYDLRVLLEPHLAQVASQQIGKSTVKRLRTIAEKMRELAGSKRLSDYRRFAASDAELHDTIAEAAGNTLIRSILADQHIHLHIFRLGLHSRVTLDAIQEHEELIDGIEVGVPADAAGAMLSHLQKSRERFRAIFRDLPLDNPTNRKIRNETGSLY